MEWKGSGTPPTDLFLINVMGRTVSPRFVELRFPARGSRHKRTGVRTCVRGGGGLRLWNIKLRYRFFFGFLPPSPLPPQKALSIIVIRNFSKKHIARFVPATAAKAYLLVTKPRSCFQRGFPIVSKALYSPSSTDICPVFQ